MTGNSHLQGLLARTMLVRTALTRASCDNCWQGTLMRTKACLGITLTPKILRLQGPLDRTACEEGLQGALVEIACKDR